jgi:nitrite reductase (NADH) small subunit
MCSSDSPANWVRITAVENIPAREGRKVSLGALDLAVFNLGDRFVALENRCPHQGGPLVDGIVSNVGGRVTVTCPLHARRICADSGEVLKPAGGDQCVRTFPTRVENGILMLDAVSLRQGVTLEAAPL